MNRCFLTCITLVIVSLSSFAQPSSQISPQAQREIVQQMIRDRELTAKCVQEEGGPSQVVGVDAIELNNDRTPEYLVYGTHGCACGARRCLQWVYRKTSTGYELLLSAGPVDEITPLKTITNGYRDLKVIAPVGNSATIQTYRFDGRRYTNQKIAQRGSEGSQDWSSFFSTFRTAAQNHDRMAIRNMMSPNFEYGVETESRDNALKYMNEANGGWADLNKVLARGVVPFRKSGRQAYVAPPTGNSRTYKGWSAVFELGEDGRWHWTAFRFPD